MTDNIVGATERQEEVVNQTADEGAKRVYVPARGGNKLRRPRTMQKRERTKEEGKMSVLGIRRVAKVGEGAKRFSFSVCVVVGDMGGQVGLGLGKGRDVNSAIIQATARARKAQVKIPLKNGTVPYQSSAVFCKSQVLLRSAPNGTGLKAGNVVRAICTCLGVENVVTKVIGNRNFLNVAKATIKALTKIRPGIV